MQESKDFYNDGSGWVCRQCEAELRAASDDGDRPSRLLLEGEAEGKQPKLSHFALAIWADKLRTTLTCPRCGVVEKVSD